MKFLTACVILGVCISTLNAFAFGPVAKVQTTTPGTKTTTPYFGTLNSPVSNVPLCVCGGGFQVNQYNQTVCLKDCNGYTRLANEVDCKFPFQYNGVWYDTCTAVNNNNKYWCSIDTIYQGRMTPCQQACPQLARNLINVPNEIHTACVTTAPGFVGIPPQPADIAVIVQQHNAIRGNVTVKAADMNTVFWDFDLARLAQRWAENGVFDHDCPVCRQLLNNFTIPVGQNMFATKGLTSYVSPLFWQGVIGSWYAELKYFVYGTGSTTGVWENCAHYTQMITNTVQRIGCGLARNGTFYLAVCNYAMAQTSPSNPYTAGKTCANCTSSCVNNLCSCPLFCQNNGVLDQNKCVCNCPSYAYGTQCENLNCAISDSKIGCWSNDRSDPWVCSYANTEVSCPHTCGICDYLPAANYTGFF